MRLRAWGQSPMRAVVSALTFVACTHDTDRLRAMRERRDGAVQARDAVDLDARDARVREQLDVPADERRIDAVADAAPLRDVSREVDASADARSEALGCAVCVPGTRRCGADGCSGAGCLCEVWACSPDGCGWGVFAESCCATDPPRVCRVGPAGAACAPP